jgi:hypothetical protein
MQLTIGGEITPNTGDERTTNHHLCAAKYWPHSTGPHHCRAADIFEPTTQAKPALP